MDLSLGVRIHGNMAALAAGIPTLVIAPDHRVLELVKRMQIPHITGADELLSKNFDIAELLSTTSFDGYKFDLNRCSNAKSYEQIFKYYGLQIKETISKLASSCP